MKSIVKILVAMSVASFSVSALLSSCVNHEYELSEDNINTEVVLFQEGLALPLGKTAPVTLGELYEQYGKDLKDYIRNEDGKYGFRYAGSFDFSNDVAGVKDRLDISALKINEKYSFDLSNVDLGGLEIPAGSISPDPIDVSSMVKIPDFALPVIQKSMQIQTGVDKPDAADLALDFADLHLDHTAELSSLSGLVPDLSHIPYWDTPMKYEDVVALGKAYGKELPVMTLATGFDPATINIPVKISLPKGIKSVKDIELHPGANVELIIEVINPLFIDGQIIPHLDIDLHNIFHIDKASSDVVDNVTQHIKDNFVLTNTTDPAWAADHIYYVDALALGPDDWQMTDEGLVLDKELSVTVAGTLENKDLRTSLRHLYENGGKPMQVFMSLKLNNFIIDNVKMEIEPISIVKSLEMPVNVPGIDLPEIISEVEYIDLENDLNLTMQASLPEALKDLDVKLETLEVTFPEGLVVEHHNYSNGKLTYRDVSLREGLNDAVAITRLNLPEPVEGRLSYDGKVMVTATAVANGVVESKNLLDVSKFGDIKVDVNVDYAPALKDYSVVIKDYPYEVNVDKVIINEKISEELGKMDEVAVYLEGDPVIRVAFDYPTAGGAIRIVPDKVKGLKIYFPEMVRFKQLPPAYNYDLNDNSIMFSGNQPIPDVLELPIEKLVIAPHYVVGDGYYIKGEVKVEGGVCLEGTRVDKGIVDALIAENASVSFSAEIPMLRPAGLSMGQYTASIKETIPFDMMKIDGVPEMIKSIDVIDLKDVYLNLELDASSVVEHIQNVDIDLDFNVTLPKLIKVVGAQSGNVLNLSGKLNKDNKIIINPVRIVGLDLSEIKMKDQTILLDEQKIDIDGNVSLKNLSVDIQNLNKDKLSLAVTGSIATRGSDKIKLEKVEATVDYQLDPISQTLSFAGIMGDLEDNIDYALDLNRYHLALDLKTNLALPLQAKVEILPYYGDKVDESKKKSLPLEVNWSLPANDTTHTRLWISNSESDKPADKDYDHKVLDLLSLINDMPDSIRFDVYAGTEPDAKFVFEPAADYVLKADYAFELPFEFGEDFHVSFSQVLEDLPEEINDVLAYGSVGLGGKVTNSLPLQFDLEFHLLDDEGDIIPLADGSGSQTIRPCALDGTPQETDLKVVLGLDKTADKTEIAAIELQFKISSRGVGGIQFHEDCFIQAELAALIPEGLHMDANDLLSVEENNK